MTELSEATSAVQREYESRLGIRKRAAERWHAHDRRFSNARLAVFVAGILQGFLTFGTHYLTAPWLIPTVVVFVSLLVLLGQQFTHLVLVFAAVFEESGKAL